MSTNRSGSHGLTLSHKVSLFAMFVTMIVVLASTAFDEFTQYRRTAANAEEQLQVLGKVTAFSVAAPAIFGDAGAASSVLSALEEYSTVVKAELILVEGETLAIYERGGQGDSANLKRYTTPVRWGLEDIGVLVIHFDISSLNHQLWRQVRFSLFLTLTALLLAGLGVYSMVSLVTKPLRRLANIAERTVRENDFSLRAADPKTSDEVGYLTQAFNTMLDSIQSQNLDLQETQKVLLGNERRLMLANAAAGLGVWDHDLVKRTMLWDKKMSSILGIKHSPDSHADTEFLELLHPDDREPLLAKYDAVKEQGDELFSVFRIICPDGSMKHLRSNAMLLRDTKGKPVRMIGISLDDTARVLTEEALQDAEKLSRERLAEVQGANAELSFQKRALDEHAIVSIANAQGEITYANERFCSIFGYSREYLLGKNTQFLLGGNRPDSIYDNIKSAIVSSKTWSGDLEFKTKANDPAWVSATIVPSKSESGEVTGFISIGTDITQIKRAEKTLLRSQKMESVGELAGGLAHDFNNLLGIIIGNLDLITETGDSQGSTKTLKHRLEVAQAAALRGSILTRSLLGFARQSDEGHSPVDVGLVISRFEDLIRKSLTAVITLETTLPNNLFLVELNPADLEDCLINLSLNARDAMPDGGILSIAAENRTVDTSWDDADINLSPGDYLEIVVTDSGNGMSQEICDKIFDPFFTTKGKADGTGLGLSIVYGFIQRAKGFISVVSKLGEGTEFKMYFPRSRAELDQKDEHAWSIATKPQGVETVLVVDDEKELAVIAQTALEALGYSVFCAESGDAALEILENNSTIDLVFSDIVMPGGISGLDLASIISKHYADIKIILTSGFASGIDRPESLTESPYQMIKKPYRVSELASRVREALDAEA